jgi:hypothetical protein
MNSERAWQIIGANLDKLVGVMVTLQKGAMVEVFCDSTGANLSFSNPSGASNILLCKMTAPDLENDYGVYPHLNGFIDADGEEIPKDLLAAYLVQYIVMAKDGGAEWGWEFEVGGDG